MRVAGVSALVLACGLAWWGMQHVNPAGSDGLERVQPADPPSRRSEDGLQVFQRAFWRSPTEGDRILNAERREWMEGDEVEKWQWYIELIASPKLLIYLRDENAFGLVATNNFPSIDHAPSWFVPRNGEVDLLHSPEGDMFVMFSKDGERLYATGFGKGFRSGMPEIETRSDYKPVSSEGRLPTTPPPSFRERFESER